jgi:BirA family transcriptional regulator, biotin operon repressor / biotin---[acetyl-CoA-carboxylase] ligase
VAGTRRPLAAGLVNDAVVRPNGLWAGVSVVARTGSTNADLAGLPQAPEGAVLVAEEQTAGRGRLGRSWQSPPRSALTFSVLLRPAPAAGLRGWLPLLAGVAVASAVHTVAGLDAGLKWPNDVLVAGRKLAGILGEQSGDAVIIGIGLNVSTEIAELPPPGPGSLQPTSLAIEGAQHAAREPLLIEILNRLEQWYQVWRADAATQPPADRVRDEYLRWSVTVGQQVQVDMPGGRTLTGLASDVDAEGRLIVDGVPVAAGDVIHLRPLP